MALQVLLGVSKDCCKTKSQAINQLKSRYFFTTAPMYKKVNAINSHASQSAAAVQPAIADPKYRRINPEPVLGLVVYTD